MATPEEDVEFSKKIGDVLENQVAKQNKKRDHKMAAANDDGETESENEHDTNGGEPTNQTSVAVFSSKTLKDHTAKVMAAKERAAKANADVKSAMDAAEKAGLPRADFGEFIKIQTKKISDDRKANINTMLEMSGQIPLFHFASPAEFPLISRH